MKHILSLFYIYLLLSAKVFCQTYNSYNQTIPISYILPAPFTIQSGTGVHISIQNNNLVANFNAVFSTHPFVILKTGELYYLHTSPLLLDRVLGVLGNGKYEASIRNNFLVIRDINPSISGITGFNNTFTHNLLLPQNPLTTSSQNYVKTTAVLVPNQTNSAQIAGLSVGDKMEQYTYFDGLGREIQTVAVAQSPNMQDIVQPIVYDEFGRQTKKYLPYAIRYLPNNAPNNGAYRNNAIQEATKFYQGTANVAQTNFPFSETYLENSPNSTPLIQGNVGESWQILRNEVGLPVDVMDNRVTKSKTRALNDNESVWRWEIVPQMGGLPTKNALDYVYSATEGSPLWVEEIEDEHHNKTLIYKDKYGQVLLKKVQKTGTEFIQTYYVYDILGQLRYVLPPLAVEKLQQNGFVFDSEVNELVFYYQYDYKKRVIVKKVPNSGETHLVYDQLDRVIMSQDAIQRITNDWIITKYDVLGRVALTMITDHNRYVFPYPLNRQSLQELANTSNLKMYEERYLWSEDTKYWTTVLSFPSIKIAKILTASYYDDYDFNNDGTPDVSYDLQTAQIKGCEGTPFLGNKLKPTGSLVRLLQDYATESEARYLLTTTFYDDRGRVIQTMTESHIFGGKDIISNKYDFSGKLLKTHHYQIKGGNNDFVIQSTQSQNYDHAGRVIAVGHQINNEQEVVLSSSQYNELGQVVIKSLGKKDLYSPFLQDITYNYNIRGWLTHINKQYVNNLDMTPTQTLFGMELVYESPYLRYENGVAIPTTPNFNGNITAQKWKSSLSPDRIRSYYYQYDKLNRLTNATYTALDANNQPKEQNWFNETLTYDSNGNITNLVRTGLISQSGNQMNFGVVDDFTYQYQGNRLLKINNAVTTPTLHTGNSYNYMLGNTQAEYQYNQNGSLISDNRKGIETIIYNHLNLAKEVKMVGNNQVNNLYDAVGIKLQKNIYTNNQLENKYDYISGNVYKNGVLEFLPTTEGRVVLENNQYVYEYHYKDHLGNLRIAFREAQTKQYTATAELTNQNVEQTQFANVNITRQDKPLFVQEKACRTNTQNPLGWWKSLPVKKGDKLDIQTEGYYSPTGKHRNLSIDWSAFLFINPNYGVGQGESPLYPANSLVGIGVIPVLSSNPSSVPKSYLTAQFFKEGESVPYFQITRYITQSQENIWSQLPAIQQDILENGRVEIFVANESSTPVYFDNLTIVHKGMPIVQENHYYPFGMNLVGIEKEGTPNHRFQFMGKEKESSFGLNWTETDWRGYDGQIGRFWQVDKLTEKYWDLTPYSYSFNNPIAFTDPSGLEPPSFQEFLNGLVKASKNGDKYSGKEVKDAFDKTQNIEKDQSVNFERDKNGIWMDIDGSKNTINGRAVEVNGTKSTFLNANEKGNFEIKKDKHNITTANLTVENIGDTFSFIQSAFLAGKDVPVISIPMGAIGLLSNITSFAYKKEEETTTVDRIDLGVGIITGAGGIITSTLMVIGYSNPYVVGVSAFCGIAGTTWFGLKKGYSWLEMMQQANKRVIPFDIPILINPEPPKKEQKK